MPIEQKNLSGILNRDDEDDIRPPDHHKMLFNGRFRGNGASKRLENVVGTRLIHNAELPAGNNVTIGAFYDSPKQRLFWFVYNSNNTHGIYIIDLTTEAITTLIQNGTNTDGDVLSFDITNVITSVQIIYGDEQQGDILYWVNSQKLPCQINISQQLAGSYGIVKKVFLDVIKAVPTLNPQVVYEDNNSVTVNNLRRKLFKFKYRFVYNNNDKSCWSSHSIMPLPLYYGTLDADADPTLNADIAIVVQTGDTNVKKIEIAACESLGNTYSDFYLIHVIDKAITNTPDNDTTIYRFFNDKAYNYVDIIESLQLFDLVPIEANAMELLNGNVLIYGGIKESYNPVTDFSNGSGSTTNASGSSEDAIRTQQPVILVATQDGKSVYGTGDIHIIVLGNVVLGEVFTIYDGLTDVTYTSILNDDASDVILGLQANAILKGYTVVSSDSNNLYIRKTNAVLLKTSLTLPDDAFSASDSSYVYDWKSVFGLALVYFDYAGRSCGAVTDLDLSWSSIQYEENTSIVQVPKVQLNIWHRPPLEATYYHIVFTKNLAKQNIVQWISDRTFKDTAVQQDNYTYAYISLQSLNNFKADNPSTPLGYEFKPNDRITFMKLYNDDGTTNQIYTNKDYQIQSSVENPVINGKTETGQFVKIILPPTDSTFDFGSLEFQNYFYEIYTPAQSVANGLDVYYERNERYEIVNANASNRFHQGQLQNQTPSLGTPATFVFDKGDFYYRDRKINVANELKYTVGAVDLQSGYTPQLDLTQSYTSLVFDAQSLPSVFLTPFNYSNDNWIINILDGQAHTFNLTGNFVVRALNTGANACDILITSISPSNSQLGTQLISMGNLVEDTVYTFPINLTFTTLPGAKVFIYFFTTGPGSPQQEIRMLEGNLIINEEGKIFNQGMIDPNFSDYYASAVNSNGRAWVVNPNAAQVYNNTLLRWGLSYQINTNINQTNRFYDENFDEIDTSKGDILRLITDARTLYVYQYRGVGWLGVYTKFIQDSSSTNTLTTTNEIITKNNVQYYSGEYGLGTHPESLFAAKTAHYFFDPIRGYWVRRSNNGLEPLNEVYKGQFYIRNLITPYNKQWLRPDGSYAKILGCYDFFEEQATACLQGADGLSPNTFAFNEKNKGFVSFFSFYPEWIISCQDKMFSFLEGKLYVHDNTSAYNNFYGVQHATWIDLSFNDARMVKKTWVSMSQLSNVVWEVTSIITQLVMGSDSQQESYLSEGNFSQLEGQFHANFRRASNSRGGIINGQILKGGYMTVRLQPKDSSKFVYLSGLSVKWIDSPLTTR